MIELMIALVLGLLVIIGVTLVFTSSKSASRSTDSLGQVQETARMSFELMARDLREAGGNPCDAALMVANVVNSAQGGTPDWRTDYTDALRGYDGNVAFPGAASGTGTGERVAGTDALVVRFTADLSELTVTAHDTATGRFTVNSNTNPERVRVNDLLLVCDFRQAAIFSASAATATQIDHAPGAGTHANCSRGLGAPTICTTAGKTFQFNAGAKIGRFTAYGWYVGNNGRAASGGRSLYRVSINGVEEVAEGVQDMQVQYLVSGATDYVDAASVTNWANVLGLRVAVTLSSAEANVATTNGGRLQRPLAFTVALRNRSL